MKIVGVALLLTMAVGIAGCDRREAKCSVDAKAWAKTVFPDPKKRQVVGTTSHYNKSENACLVLVEYREEIIDGSWSDNIWLHGANNEQTYGEFSEAHFESRFDLGSIKVEPTVQVVTCKVGDKKCQGRREFDDLLRFYLDN